jgi:hypothetical protein
LRKVYPSKENSEFGMMEFFSYWNSSDFNSLERVFFSSVQPSEFLILFFQRAMFIVCSPNKLEDQCLA